MLHEVILDNGNGSAGEEIVCDFEVAGLFGGFGEGPGSEALGRDEGEGCAEDFVLEGCVRGRGGMVGRVVLPETGETGGERAT